METQSQSISNQQPFLKCGRFLRSLFSLRSLQVLFTTSPQVLVRLVTPVGLDASINEVFANRRFLAGLGFMVVGSISIVFHYLFDEAVRNFNWYYVNWFYFFYTIRVYVLLIFWSLAFFLFTPVKYRSIIPFSCAQAFGWVNVIHYSFFVTSNSEFHAVPHWSIIVLALSLAFSFSMCISELVYFWEHKRKGNHCRFVGLTEIDIPLEKKELMYKQLAKEFREHNSK